MNEDLFANAVADICARDPRYDEEAYYFARDALDFAAKALKKPRQGPERHISGTQLLDCIREFALREYGPMTRRVLRSWNIHATEDFGELVFNMVDANLLGKTDEDRKEDFAEGYDFGEAFDQPFLPRDPKPSPTAAPASQKKPRSRGSRGKKNDG